MKLYTKENHTKSKSSNLKFVYFLSFELQVTPPILGFKIALKECYQYQVHKFQFVNLQLNY